MIKADTMNLIRSKCFISWLLLINSFFLSINANSTLNTSVTLRDNGDTLISPGGDFELGFFSPEQQPNNRYVGIWYKKISPRTVIWVANRNNPLQNRSGMVRVVEPGLVYLLDATTNGSIIWSTNTSVNVQNPTATLLDSGNLVVKDANDDNPENFVWESFNHPTDHLMPGMKLGKNLVTGFEVYTSSSKSDANLAVGDYSYHCDPTGYPQNVIRKGGVDGVVTYRTGPWNGKGFSGNPNLQMNPIFTYGVEINEKEVYYHYELINDSVITMATISDNGVGQRWVWVERTREWKSYLTIPVDNCDVYNGCGPSGSCNIKNSPSCVCLDKFKPRDPQGWERGDWSNGCIRNSPLSCDKGDGFLKYSGIKLPDTRTSWYNRSMSLEECKAVCLKNCSCTAFTSLDISRGGSGCLLWFGELIDMREISPGQDIYIKLASSDLDSGGRKRIGEILIITLSLVTVVLLIGLVLYCRRRKKKNLQLQRTERGRHNFVDHNPDGSSENKDIELPLIELAALIKATDNFSYNCILGEGGFGSVYKARLDDGQEVAVKRLSKTSHQGVVEFKNEVICIAKLQHRNLVKLLGCCIQGEEKILVYEYMTNRSLDLILFDPLESKLLDWPRRFNIINGIARGLVYLHQDSRLRVIHRDLKASNILLDSNMNPKISDFGLARTFGGDETGANTMRVVGTYGYMSPEYAAEGLFSVKSDVFSFGVLVLEIVSGKKNRGFSHSDHSLNLLGHAWKLYKEGRSLELMDLGVRNSSDSREVERSIHIGLLCVQQLPADRPTMSLVVMMLSNDIPLPEAKQPGFFLGRDFLRNETSGSSNTSTSINAVTITMPEPR